MDPKSSNKSRGQILSVKKDEFYVPKNNQNNKLNESKFSNNNNLSDIGYWPNQYTSKFNNGKIQPHITKTNSIKSENQYYYGDFQESPTKASFNKKQSAQTVEASSTNFSLSSKTSSFQNNVLQQLHGKFKQVSSPKQIFHFLRIGQMQSFLNQLAKLGLDSRKIEQMKSYFKEQENFYKKLKLAITFGLDSTAFYQDQSYNFFDDIPQLFNRILSETSKLLIKFPSFSQGNKKYMVSNTNGKIIQNFNNFMLAIKEIGVEKQKDKEDQRKLQITLNLKQQQINALNQKISQLKNYDHSNSIYLQSQEEILNLKTKIRHLTGQIELLQEQNERKNTKITELETENKRFKFDSEGLINKITKSENSIRTLQNQVRTLQAELSKKPIHEKPFHSKPLITQTQLENLKNQIQAKEKQLINFKTINFELGTKQTDYLRVIRQLQDKIKSSEAKKHQDLTKYYLESSQCLSYTDKTEKFRLVSMFGQYLMKQPIQFKLLYKMQPFTQPNLHYYIDNKQNFLILIRLVNNIVIGGFCPYPMNKSTYAPSGFLFNLSTDSFYPLKQGKSCFAYDDSYFVMGNAEIRIMIDKNTVYSNFATANCYFETKNHTIGQFLQGYQSSGISRQIEMKSYEIYQVKFNY